MTTFNPAFVLASLLTKLGVLTNRLGATRGINKGREIGFWTIVNAFKKVFVLLLQPIIL